MKFGIILSLALAAQFSWADLSSYQLEELGAWTNPYNDARIEKTFLNITKLMNDYKLTRLEATLVQSEMRRLVRTKTTEDVSVAFDQALEKVLKKELSLPLKLDVLLKADFIVVFDLDETLLDQYKAKDTCSDIQFVDVAGKNKFIKLAPYAEQIIKNIVLKGGAVVLFSANLDSTTMENLSHWMIDGVPATQSPLIAGILANSFLNQYEKSKTQSMVIVPGKDLKIIDESLKNVIIVDDNPTRLFQPARHREFKKFFANEYCDGTSATKKAFDRSMEVVWREVSDAVDYMRFKKSQGADISFADAYLPYTATGQITMKWLMDANRVSASQAAQMIRKEPALVNGSF